MKCAKCGREYADDLNGCPNCAMTAKLQEKMTALAVLCVLAVVAALYFWR